MCTFTFKSVACLLSLPHILFPSHSLGPPASPPVWCSSAAWWNVSLGVVGVKGLCEKAALTLRQTAAAVPVFFLCLCSPSVCSSCVQLYQQTDLFFLQLFLWIWTRPPTCSVYCPPRSVYGSCKLLNVPVLFCWGASIERFLLACSWSSEMQ